MTQDTTDRRHSILIWVALGLVYVVWGSTYLGIGIVVQTMPPMLSGALRFLAAAVLLGGFLLLRKGRRAFAVTWRQLCGAGLVGLLLLTGGNGLVAVAEQYISTGLAALLVASVPLWLVVFRLVVRDRPKALTIAGVIVGFFGVAMLALNGGGSGGRTAGIVTILVAALSWSLGSFLSSRIPMPDDPFVASTIEMLVGGIGLALVGAGFGERLVLAEISFASWMALLYLVLVGSLVGFTSYVWLLGNAPISLVSTYAYVNPVVAVMLGALVLNESVSVQVLTGGLVIVVGVMLVISTERAKRVVEPVAPDAQRVGR